MAVKSYSILFQKAKEGSPVKDLFADFSMGCVAFPFKLSGEVKELPTDDYPDEDGEDTFIPSNLVLKAYDLDVDFSYKGNNAERDVSGFIDYLLGYDGNGASLKVYNPYTNIGRHKIYITSYNEPEYNRSDEGEVANFSVAFRVTDPRTRIVPVYDEDNNVTRLTTT